MYDEDDDEYDTDDYVAPRGLSLGKSPFAAMLGRAKESNGAFVYDTAGRSIRRDGGRPLTDEAEAQYAQQSGALDQLAQRFGVQRTKADDSEKWLSVAAALFAPTETGKTSESLAKALGAYATATGDQKKEERSTSLALAKLMQRYESDAMRAQAVAAKTQAAALAPKWMSVAPGAKLVDVNAVNQLPVYTPEQAAALPQGTGKFRGTDGEIYER